MIFSSKQLLKFVFLCKIRANPCDNDVGGEKEENFHFQMEAGERCG